jgi:hypothetical protein
LQVVQATDNSIATIATTTFTDQGLSGTITPTLATSKILVLVTSPNQYYRLAANQGMKMQLLRDATVIWTTTLVGSFQGNNTTVTVGTHTTTINYLDSPATTSAIIYKIQIAPTDITSTGQVFCNNGSATNNSIMVLLEIGA